ncbi:MAG: BglII/BstYI family type II restriction endonuclease [Pseudomonadota bacterium]
MKPLPNSVAAKFEVFDWRNALTILQAVHANEFEEIVRVLADFELRWSTLAAKGKNKTETAKLLDASLYRLGWVEKAFDTEILVDKVPTPSPTHSIDCYKNRVALEVEWNNKDPFFDRDLNNFRLLYDLRVIDVGVIITRTTALQRWLNDNHEMLERDSSTYGASTTHFDKLKPKIEGGGAGGCPVLVFSIKREAFIDDRPA